MRVANFTDPQFVDAVGVGGLNAAFNLTSGSISSMGSGVWAAPGLLFPESMSLSFASMVATAGLPTPWGVVTSGGIVVRAHGVLTGQDTTNYSINFAPLVPGSGSVTAYLAATITTIQQNPFPLTGPPQGHPSFNPNFVPSVAYATTAYSVALTAVTGTVDNITTFELARVLLSAGQVTVSGYSTLGWRRAALSTPRPAGVLASGGALTLAQSAGLILPGVSGLTSTLPLAVSGGGLTYQLFNPSASTVWTVAAGAGNVIAGTGGATVASVGIPPLGSLSLWGNATSGQWDVVGSNPQMMTALANSFTAPQTIIDSSLSALALVGTGSNGVNLKMTGNGATTPSKTIRIFNGVYQIINNAYTAAVLTLDDSGNFSALGAGSFGSLAVASTATVGGGMTVAGGLYATSTDAGGLQIRTATGAGPGAGFRNDGAAFYLLMSNNGAPTGGFNGLRPMTVNLTNGQIVLDGTGAGVSFGGLVNTPNINATVGTIGSVTFPGGGVISTPGAITSGSQIFGNSVTSTGNVTSNTGRMRAALGAFHSGDLNAGVILSDFFVTNAGVGGVMFLPNGFMIQWGVVNVPGNSTPTLFNLPTAFPNSGIQIVGSFGAHTPPQQAVGFDLANNAQFWAMNTSSGPGNGCYFIAFGL